MSSSTRPSTSSTDPKPRIASVSEQDRDKMQTTFEEGSAFRRLNEDDKKGWLEGLMSVFDRSGPSIRYASSTDPKPRIASVSEQDRAKTQTTLEEESVCERPTEEDENVWLFRPTSASDSTRPSKGFTTSNDPKPSLAPTPEEYRAILHKILDEERISKKRTHDEEEVWVGKMGVAYEKKVTHPPGDKPLRKIDDA